MAGARPRVLDCGDALGDAGRDRGRAVLVDLRRAAAAGEEFGTENLKQKTENPSHPHILTSSHPHTLTASHPHILTSSHPHILTSSHPHILTSSQARILPSFF